MPKDNIEIVRRILDSWAGGDFRTPVNSFHPEIAFETFMPDANENVVAHGTAEFEAFTRDWLAQWRGYRIVADEFRQVGRDKIFVAVRQIAAGRQSGVEVEAPGFSVWTLRQGKVIKLSLHYDSDKAFKAAGIES